MMNDPTTPDTRIGIDLVVVLLFAVLTAAPLVLFVMGDRGESIENRQPVARPPVDLEILIDTSRSAEMDTYLADALPRRQDAVQLNARADLALGDSPSADVRLGRDGWYFFNNTFRQPCVEGEIRDRLVAELAKIDRLVESTGREIVFALGPDKVSIHQAQLDDDPGCSVATATGLAEDVAEADLVVGWEELRAASAEVATYYEKDTHWTPRGAAVFAELVVERIEPEAWIDDIYVERVDERTSDLSILVGYPEEEPAEVLSVRTPGRVVSEGAGDECSVTRHGVPPFVTTYRTVPPAAAPLQIPTVFLHDSFGCDVAKVLGPHFAQLDDVVMPDPSRVEVEPYIERAEAIVWLVTQRNFYGEVVFKDLYGRFAIGLRDDLPTAKVNVEWDDMLGTVQLPKTPDSVIWAQLADGVQEAEVGVGDVKHVLSPDKPFVLLPRNSAEVSFVLHRGDVEVWAVEPQV